MPGLLSQNAGKSKNFGLTWKTLPFFLAWTISSLWQITPLELFFLDLQTWTQTVPGPLTRILNVGDSPTGTVAPLLGESGVMPLAASADAPPAAAATMAPVARAPARVRELKRRVIGPA